MALSCSFAFNGQRSEFPADALFAVPVEDRANVIRINAKPFEGGSKLTPQAVQRPLSPSASAACHEFSLPFSLLRIASHSCSVSLWLQNANLGFLAEALVRNRVTLDLLKYVKDIDLINMGALSFSLSPSASHDSQALLIGKAAWRSSTRSRPDRTRRTEPRVAQFGDPGRRPFLTFDFEIKIRAFYRESSAL